MITLGQVIPGNVPPEPRIQLRLLVRGHHLKRGDGVADQAHRVDKAQAIRVETSPHGRLVHDATDRIMRDQQPIEFLEDSHGLLAAQRVTDQTWMRVNRIDGDLDLPACMIRPAPLSRWRVLDG